MLRFEQILGNGSIQKAIDRLENNFPLDEISDEVQSDIQDETMKRGWNRIKDTIKKKVVDKNTHEIYIGGKKEDVMVSIFLNDGTKPHHISPIAKKALHWLEGKTGKDMFSKGHVVKGIAAENFFGLYGATIRKLGEITTKFIYGG